MPKPDRHPMEQEHHQKAFELYYAQGAKRSYQRLAQELGVALATVKAWSRNFHWQQRLRERDATAARQVADQTLRSTTEDLSRNQKLVQLAFHRLAKAILNGQVKYQLADVDRLIRLQAFLDGHGDGHPPIRTAQDFIHHHKALFQSLPDSVRDEVIAYYEQAEAEQTRADADGMSPPPTEHPGPPESPGAGIPEDPESRPN